VLLNGKTVYGSSTLQPVNHIPHLVDGQAPGVAGGVVFKVFGHRAAAVSGLAEPALEKVKFGFDDIVIRSKLFRTKSTPWSRVIQNRVIRGSVMGNTLSERFFRKNGITLPRLPTTLP
jgi:hypothetical protein